MAAAAAAVACGTVRRLASETTGFVIIFRQRIAEGAGAEVSSCQHPHCRWCCRLVALGPQFVYQMPLLLPGMRTEQDRIYIE